MNEWVRRVKRVREQNDKQKTDRWPLPLQGHKSNNARKEKRGKITGREMWWGGRVWEREWEWEPEAEHDGQRPWGAISLKDRKSQKETTGTLTLQRHPLNDLCDANLTAAIMETWNWTFKGIKKLNYISLTTMVPIFKFQYSLMVYCLHKLIN